MIYLSWAFRAMFCKHDFKHEEIDAKHLDSKGEVIKQGTKVSATCNKRGWHRNYWKYN